MIKIKLPDSKEYISSSILIDEINNEIKTNHPQNYFNWCATAIISNPHEYTFLHMVKEIRECRKLGLKEALSLIRNINTEPIVLGDISVKEAIERFVSLCDIELRFDYFQNLQQVQEERSIKQANDWLADQSALTKKMVKILLSSNIPRA